MTQHLALYRKYRPTGFDSLIGQDAIKVTLMNALRLGKASHAYLFTGPRGTGKTSSAKILAKALNCLNPKEVEPCGICDACKDSNPDIIEMDAASNNGVDEIRDLREKVIYTPVYGKYKVYIIDEVHMLTTQAFNALLKTLEEPPAHAVFILATTEPHKIPLTILSRCQRYDFRRIAQEEIVMRMELIVQEEKAEVEKEALQLIAQIAAGGMRDALSLLDQAISHATGKVSLQDVIELTGAVDTRKIGRLIQYIGCKDIEGALEHFNSCFQSGQEPKFFIEEMMNYYRDILLYEKLGEKATLKKGVTDPAFHSVREAVNSSLVFHHLDILQSTLGKMKFHHDIHLLVEMAIVEMVNEKNEDLRAQIIQLRQEVEKIKLSGGSVATSEKSLKADVLPMEQNIESDVQEAVVSGTGNFEEQEEAVPSFNPAIEQVSDLQEVEHPESIGDKEESIAKHEITENNVLDSLSLEDLMGGISEVPSFNPNVDQQPAVGTQEESAVAIIEEQPDNTEEVNEVPSFESMVEQAVASGEDWVQVIDENQIPPDPEEDLQEVELAGIPITAIPEQNPSVAKPAAPVLTKDELGVLDILDSCNKELRTAFASSMPSIMDVLKETRMSTHALIREFSLRAVGSSHVIMSHPDNVKVKLMTRVSNKSIMESVMEEVYQPLQLVLVSNEQWEKIVKAVREKIG